jgi:hypothetical protein
VRLVERTLVAIKLRVDLSSGRFIDVFFNCRNGRTDLSVVEGERRIFGYDNLGGWHRHPVNAPDDHEPCDVPSLEQFLVEASQLSVGPRR